MPVAQGETIDTHQLDKSGKTVFDDIYNAPDPRRYYHAMHALDYCIPAEAKPYFNNLINAYRHTNPQKKNLKVMDLGASYGINAALLQWNLRLQDLYQHYVNNTPKDSVNVDWSAQDRKYFAQLDRNPTLEVIGFDIAENALRYALNTGIMPQAIHANFEEKEATASQKALIREIDCIISSGCIGYVTETSLGKILDICGPQKPWMSHCILRMFQLEPYETLLRDRGYHVKREEKLLPQRRFASPEEQQQVIARLEEGEINTKGYESEGWLYARVLVATPRHGLSGYC